MNSLPAHIWHQLSHGDVVLAVILALAAFLLACRIVSITKPRTAADWLMRSQRLALQLGGALCLEQAYEITRARIPHESDVAMLNAYRLLDLEWSHGLFIESRVERFFLQFQTLMNTVDVFYVIGHVGATLGALVWVYLWRRDHYPLFRNLLGISTAIALISFYVYPTAPPRMLANYGFVDPLQLHNLVRAGGEQPSSYTYNPYAAMPSLHVAYALIVGYVVFLAEKRHVVRALAICYPVAMSAAVIISGNHWLLDVVGALVTVCSAVLILRMVRRFAAQVAWQGRFPRGRWVPALPTRVSIDSA